MSEPRRVPSYRAIPAEGARVGITSCLDCGAALMIDPDDYLQGIDVPAIHIAWHELNRTLP
jgi:hypothetical protein